MTHPRFFGYGSLVNCSTHTYPNTRKATLSGWRRAWVRTLGYSQVLLSVRPDPGTEIAGLTADVPSADWTALDMREAGYQRSVVTPHVPDESTETWVYAVHDDNVLPHGEHMILQSYLDAVLQGFLRLWGEEGVHTFFETTDGWDVPVLNDRDAPRYPRHQVLSDDERGFFDTLYAERTR